MPPCASENPGHGRPASSSRWPAFVELLLLLLLLPATAAWAKHCPWAGSSDCEEAAKPAKNFHKETARRRGSVRTALSLPHRLIVNNKPIGFAMLSPSYDFDRASNSSSMVWMDFWWNPVM